MKINNRCSRLQLSALAIVGFFYSLQAAAVDYTITDIGTLGAPSGSVSSGINNSGQVVGHAITANPSRDHAFLYQNGTMIDLGTLPGGFGSGASAINDFGQVVGASDVTDGSTHVFLYDGTMRDLGLLGWDNQPHGINNSGNIVGETNIGVSTRAYLFDGTTLVNLGALNPSGDSKAYAINDSGQIVGYGAVPTSSGAYIPHAFLYQNGVMQDLFPGSTVDSRAWDINNNGQVVGYYGGQGFIYDHGTTTLMPWSPRAINNQGQAIGGLGGQPMMFYDGQNWINLSSALSPTGWSQMMATDINDLGMIAGTGIFGNNQHSFLLTPTSVVPIPAAFWLFGSGLIGLIGFARKRNTPQKNEN